MADIDDLLKSTQDKMTKAIDATQHEFGIVRTGRANPLLLERIQLDYYGTPTPIPQMANISVQGGQTIIIQPYDKSALMDIEKAIAKSELGLPANSDGTVIRINVPPLTEERRKEMVKLVKKMGEDGKVAIRNIRRDAFSELEKRQKADNMSEDAVKDHEAALQKLTDRFNKDIETIVADKETEVLQI